MPTKPPRAYATAADVPHIDAIIDTNGYQPFGAEVYKAAKEVWRLTDALAMMREEAYDLHAMLELVQSFPPSIRQDPLVHDFYLDRFAVPGLRKAVDIALEHGDVLGSMSTHLYVQIRWSEAGDYEGMTFESLAAAEMALREMAFTSPMSGYDKTQINFIPKNTGEVIHQTRIDLQRQDQLAVWTFDSPRDGYGWQDLRNYHRRPRLTKHEIGLLDRIRESGHVRNRDPQPEVRDFTRNLSQNSIHEHRVGRTMAVLKRNSETGRAKMSPRAKKILQTINKDFGR